jgi:hypothetical protein
MIGSLAKLAAFAAKARLRGDLRALNLARSVVQEAENKLDQFTAGLELTLPKANLRQWVGDAEFSIRLADLYSEEGSGLYESLSLAVICLLVRPKSVFEFASSKSPGTALLARYSPESARIHILDLNIKSIANPAGNKRSTGASAGPTMPDCVQEQIDRGRIVCLAGNSMAYDFAEFDHACDLIFIDAGQSYPFAQSDTEHAFEMLRQGGVIIWHHYKPTCPGVVRAVNEAGASRRIYHIDGTSLAVFGLTQKQ